MRRRRILICYILFAFVLMTAPAVYAQEDISEHRSCSYCGMDRKAYGYSRMLVVYDDGSKVGVCSLHCAVVELEANKGRKVKSILAADRNTKTLTDAETAVWVLGGKKKGVMTQRPKWAFSSKAAAQAFVDSNGGTIISWAEALAAAQDDAKLTPR